VGLFHSVIDYGTSLAIEMLLQAQSQKYSTVSHRTDYRAIGETKHRGVQVSFFTKGPNAGGDIERYLA
jgi:hypothetical protein